MLQSRTLSPQNGHRIVTDAGGAVGTAPMALPPFRSPFAAPDPTPACQRPDPLNDGVQRRPPQRFACGAATMR